MKARFLQSGEKSAFILLLIALVISPGAAQETCGLENPPSIFGLKLGISPEEVQNVFGKNLRVKIKKSGDKTFFQNFIDKPPPQSLTGVRALYLRFFDRRIYEIEIFYEETNKQQTLEEFTEDLATNLKLPKMSWQIVKGKAEIKCVDFTIVADKILNPRIILTNETISAKAKKSRIKSSTDKYR